MDGSISELFAIVKGVREYYSQVLGEETVLYLETEKYAKDLTLKALHSTIPRYTGERPTMQLFLAPSLSLGKSCESQWRKKLPAAETKGGQRGEIGELTGYHLPRGKAHRLSPTWGKTLTSYHLGGGKTKGAQKMSPPI